MHNFYKMIYAI